MVVGEPKRSIMEGIENTGDVRLHDHRLRLKQRFDIIRKLGQGTYGKVQLGINKKTGQEVAIKTIKKCKIETEADLVRIRREVQIMSSVRHPNIVHIYEVFENSEKMILVMEYCAGGELYDYLSQQKVLQEDEARRLFRQIATAVYYCHKHKICHRDLKLENVLLDEHGSAKIADFGLSNVFEERRLLSTFCGSPLYASPEIVKGTPYIGPEVDCWSLGVLLYTLVYGAMPFDGSNFKRLVKQISTGDYFEPKNPSSASPLIRDMLTVDPVQRADITHICDDPWVNKGSDVSCLELAEALANETPVRLDLLLSLAPPPVSDKLVVTDEINNVGPDGSPARSMSVANVDNSAERRILEMVAEGGTDAIKPSPTRTIVSAEQQPKRKLETTVSMDSAPSQRKKERTLRSSSVIQNPQNSCDIPVAASNDKHVESVETSKDVCMENNKEPQAEMVNEPVVQETPKQELTQPKETAKPESSAIKSNMSQLTMEIPKETKVTTEVKKIQPESSKTPVTVHANKESKTDAKTKDPQLKEKNVASSKPAVVKKKIIASSVKKDEKPKSTISKEKSPPRKSIEKDIAGRVLTTDKKPEANKTEEAQTTKEVSPVKQSTERRRSRILDAAEKLNNLSIQPNNTSPTENAQSPPTAKPKKVVIPGVSVGSFKEQFERRASLTSGNIPVPTNNEVKKPIPKTPQGPIAQTQPATNKTLANKKIHSVDSEHPETIIMNNTNKDNSNIKLQTIGVEPTPQPKEEPVKMPEQKKPAIVEVNKVSKPLHKSESLKEPSKRDILQSSLSLEDARRSLQQSMALLNQAKSESKTMDSPEDERQKQLKTAREIISNAIGDDPVGKKVNRICMGGKPPVPYGSGGRSASGNISLSSLSSLPGSPPISPPHTRPLIRESPAKTFRTEVQHRVDDVRNKYLPNSRGSSVERIIPIQFAETAPKTQSSGQLPYQRHNTTPYRFSSLPRGCTPDYESEPITQNSTPSTPSIVNKAEPIKKSPREFIIPIAVEGKGYVTPRQGSLEPSETPTKMTPTNISFHTRFSKPRRLSSLVSGGESEEEDDSPMHRLRSSRRKRIDAEKESVSSGEEDDDEGFELLTAENLFSTLLDRVRSLTNKLNGEEGPGFSQHSLFNNLHSPFFNSPHLPRKHKRHDIIREAAPWRRSTSRDISSNFDSMFPSHPTFPRGSKKSRKAAASNKIQQDSVNMQKNGETELKRNTHLDDHETNKQESLDLSDLDLSKIELSEKDMETLSGLTPALSRRLQKQLLDHLPPAAARSLRRTLSMNNTGTNEEKSHHKYTRSLSASKTENNHSYNIPEEENYPIQNKQNKTDSNKTQDVSTPNNNVNNNFEYKLHSYDDEDTSSMSFGSISNKIDKDNNNFYDLNSRNYNTNIKQNNSFNSLDYINNKSESSHSESVTPRLLSSVRHTPEKSILSKYLSPERNFSNDDYMSSYNKNSDLGSLITDPSYLAAYGNNNTALTMGGSLKRRSLRTPPAETTPRRRISRFLRPDFFDTPREESIYVKDKIDKESETQKILKEIREKRNRSGATSPISPMVPSDITSLFENANSRLSSRNCLSPVSPLTPNRSRSVTPFYPILDNINESHTDNNANKDLCDTLLSINKKLDESNSMHSEIKSEEKIQAKNLNNKDKNDNLCVDTSDNSLKESKISRPKSFPYKNNEKLNISKESSSENNDVFVTINREQKDITSKIARPKSYPATTPSPEKKCNIPLLDSQKINANNINLNNNSEMVSKDVEDDNGNVSVSFSVSLPSKPIKKPEKKTTATSETPVEEKKKTLKKKIIVKKKSSSQKSIVNNKNGEETATKSVPNENSPLDASADTAPVNNQRQSSPKKKSVLQSLGQKFEKLRNEKCAPQEQNSTEKNAKSSTSNGKDEIKPSRIENVMRVLRERSVPTVNNVEPITESGLIKRAVTITNLPTMEDGKDGPKKAVNRVLGLFKKNDSKEKNPKPVLNTHSTISEVNTEIVENTERLADSPSEVNQIVENKPKRPTSLLLNGIGKRVQACYNGVTTDSVLSKIDKSVNGEDDKNFVKTDDVKTQKKGLRLDFSRLPKLNQGIFNKRNSLDLSKSRESSEVRDTNSSQGANTDIDDANSEECSLKQSDQMSDNTILNGTDLATPDINWSPDLDTSKLMINTPELKETTHSHHEPDSTLPESENIIDRIRRKSFYSRFNEKKNRRKSLLVGPGAKEYIPSARINPQCDNDNINYSNKYDLSPTSPNKFNMSPTISEHSRPSYSLDKSECLTPTSPRVRSSFSNDQYFSPTSHKHSDRSDQKYSIDSLYPTGLECSTYSIPRYSRTLSYFDDIDTRPGLSEPKSSTSRYGRTLSLLSPGIYATYSPRAHTRNSAILLRDSSDVEVNPESVLTKIRNRKKSAAQSMQLEEDHHLLDSRCRSNHTQDSEHDMPAEKSE